MCYTHPMTPTTGQPEGPFAEASPELPVDELVVFFDETAETATPTLVTLEAAA